MIKANIEVPVMEIEFQDDEYWINRISKDTSAFEVIYDRYLPKVSRYIYRKVGDQMATEDLTSLVFFHALEGIMKGRYSSRYKFSAWIFSIARTKIADYFRERKTISLEELNEELATANHRVRTTKINSNLDKCFSELSKFEQELLVLRFSAELDFSTIASILHKNTAAVKMATYRSLRNLRIKMEGLNE